MRSEALITERRPALHGDWDDTAFWSRANMAEAIPGVVTPLNWSVWGPVGERSIRWGFHAVGALERDEVRVPEDPRQRCLVVFYGRPAAKLDFFCAMGDRIPGASGAMIAEQYLGEVPAGLVSKRDPRRYHVVAAKMPRLFVTIPSRLAAAAAFTDSWWRSELELTAGRELPALRRQMRGGAARMELSVSLTAEAAFAGAQPVWDQVVGLAESVGRPELAGKVLAGHGSHVETRLVEDLWEVSRKRLELDTYLDRYGYHGPLEGEIASKVWREDATPVRALVERYAALGEADSPVAGTRKRAAEGAQAERELLAALPRGKRPVARVMLKLARTYLPLRGIGKIPFLQSLDVIRAGARRAGELLAAEGHLDDPDDVVWLTLDELCAPPEAAWRDRVAERREEHAGYQGLELPMNWRGRPEPVAIESTSDAEAADVALTGVAASPGVVEGPVRVVLDASFAEIEEGEILVAPTTDPSWASVLFYSSALVVDIGGALSHAAVVAREMGVPCVMGTGVGTRSLRTGDVCRVDGTTGQVTLLNRAAR